MILLLCFLQTFKPHTHSHKHSLLYWPLKVVFFFSLHDAKKDRLRTKAPHYSDILIAHKSTTCRGKIEEKQTLTDSLLTVHTGNIMHVENFLE